MDEKLFLLFWFVCYRKSLLENEIIDDISKNELKKEIQNEEDNNIDDTKANSIADDKKVSPSISIKLAFSRNNYKSIFDLNF